jgi:hypothetical protein
MLKQPSSSHLSTHIAVVLIVIGLISPVMGIVNNLQQTGSNVGSWNTEIIVPYWEAPVPENSADGRAISLVLDRDNRPHIAYYNATNREIRYVTRFNNKWIDERIVSSAGTSSVSIAVDAAGDPSISYGDGFHFGNLMYAEKKEGAWRVTRVDRGSYSGVENSSLGNAGQYSSLVLDDNGNPHISYNDGLNFGNLKYAVRKDGTWETERVDRGVNGILLGSTGYDSSLKLDSSKNPGISYRDGNYYGSLMYAEKKGEDWIITKIDTGWDWDNETIQDPAGDTGSFTALALDGDGNPVITYYDMKKKSLMNAQRMWPRTSFVNWPPDLQPISSTNDTGRYVSLAIDTKDHRHLSFYDATGKSLIYYQLDGRSILVRTVDSGGAGRYSSLALDASGSPHIAYYRAADNTIRYASGN